MMYKAQSAVLLITFNRPKHASLVLEKIREVKPPRIYISVDGPRDGNTTDHENCEACKNLVKKIDWDCEIKTLFQKKNLGCKMGPATAISWFFENEEMGIILEDDCIPTQSFFRYCDELLEKYKDIPNIGMISGNNPVSDKLHINESYTFSKYTFIWGWASWRRAWSKIDLSINDWPKLQSTNFLSTISPGNVGFEKYWNKQLCLITNTDSDVWDYQWLFTHWKHNLLTIVPCNNTIKNIGFGIDATHTIGTEPLWSHKAKATELNFPLKHPNSIVRNIKFDNLSSQIYYGIGIKMYLRWLYPSWLFKLIPVQTKALIKAKLQRIL